MTTQPKHTPTPWATQGSKLRGKYAHCLPIFPVSKVDGRGIGPELALLPPGSDEVQAANAAFIVTACNGHDSLIDALTKIANSSVGIDEKNGSQRAWMECARIARTALKAAKREA